MTSPECACTVSFQPFHLEEAGRLALYTQCRRICYNALSQKGAGQGFGRKQGAGVSDGFPIGLIIDQISVVPSFGASVTGSCHRLLFSVKTGRPYLSCVFVSLSVLILCILFDVTLGMVERYLGFRLVSAPFSGFVTRNCITLASVSGSASPRSRCRSLK